MAVPAFIPLPARYTLTMNISLADIIGLVGVGLVVGTYFLSQIGRMRVDTPLYPGLNGVGAVMILYSLGHTFNLASAVIEAFWLAISLVGLVRSLRRRRGT